MSGAVTRGLALSIALWGLGSSGCRCGGGPGGQAVAPTSAPAPDQAAGAAALDQPAATPPDPATPPPPPDPALGLAPPNPAPAAGPRLQVSVAADRQVQIEVLGATAADGVLALVEWDGGRHALAAPPGRAFAHPGPTLGRVTLAATVEGAARLLEAAEGDRPVTPALDAVDSSYRDATWQVSPLNLSTGRVSLEVRRHGGGFLALRPLGGALAELVVARLDRRWVGLGRPVDGHARAAHDPEAVAREMEALHDGATDTSGRPARKPGAGGPIADEATPADRRVLDFDVELPGPGTYDLWLRFDPGVGPVQALTRVEVAGSAAAPESPRSPAP